MAQANNGRTEVNHMALDVTQRSTLRVLECGNMVP